MNCELQAVTKKQTRKLKVSDRVIHTTMQSKEISHAPTQAAPHIRHTQTPTHTQSAPSLCVFAPPLKHGHFSLGTTSPCELTHRSVTTHNPVRTRQIFPYILTLRSDLTALQKLTNQATSNIKKKKPEAPLGRS